MAVAWIAWRNSAIVRDHCAEFAKQCLYWTPQSWNVPINNGTEFACIDGHELKELGQPTVCRLALVDALPPIMTVAEAEKQLFAELAAGRIIAIAKDAAGNVVEIPQREWPYLQRFEEGQADVLKYAALDQKPAFTEVKLPRETLKQVWQESPVELYMLGPMMRLGTAGYVPLCSALHWVMTEAGQKFRHLEDTQSWKAAVERLISLMSTGEVQVIGRDIHGQSGTIDGVIFAGISVGEPFRESFSLISGDKPWISCTPYIDEEHWERSFNDCMYLKSFGPASWTHLKVKKADVFRHITFEANANENTNGDAVVVAGKSTSPALQQQIRDAAKELWPNGGTPARVKERDAAITGWFSKKNQTAPSARTIYRALK
jgi:hypothetical protein